MKKIKSHNLLNLFKINFIKNNQFILNLKRIIKNNFLIQWIYGYPSIYHNTPNQIFEIPINIFRLNFWNYFARKNPYFRSLYINNLHNKSIIKNSQTFKADNIDELIARVKNIGCAYLEDYLEKNAYSEICKEFDNNNFNNYKKFGYGVKCFNKTILDENINIFQNDISYITKNLLGKKINIRSIGVQRLQQEDYDLDDPNTKFHIDRFIPAIKIFYFPFEIDEEHSPFGYIPYSHMISPEYKSSIISGFKNLKEIKKPPFEIDNPTCFSEIPILCKKNTLVISFTNGIHRRIPFKYSKTGDRKSLRFIFYNHFTRLDLLKKSF